MKLKVNGEFGLPCARHEHCVVWRNKYPEQNVVVAFCESKAMAERNLKRLQLEYPFAYFIITTVTVEFD